MAAAGPFSAWWSALKTRVGPAFQAQTILFFGDNELGKYKNSRPPAIAYELKDDNYTSEQSMRRGPANGPDQLATSETTVLMHVWAGEPDATHELRRHLIASLHDLLSAESYRLGPGSWHTSEVVGNGSAYVFQLTLKIPITRDADTLATIDDFIPQTEEIIGGGGGA